jgi:glycosyltransferase involved in cell wall biosynthesis
MASLGLIALAAPWLARGATETLHEAIEPLMPIGRESLPGAEQLLVLTLTTLFAGVLRRSFVTTYLASGVRSLVIVSCLWAVAGTTFWLALLFFAGSLASLDRVFPLAHVLILAALLIIARLVAAARIGAPHVLAILAALALVLSWQGWPTVTLAGAKGFEATPILLQLLTPPLIVPLSLVAAAAIARITLPDRPAPKTNLIAGVISFALWISVTHFVWLVFLFAFGAVDVPRWLPIATAMVMGIVGVVAPTAWALRYGGGLIEQLYDRSKAEAAGAKAEFIASTAPRANRAGRRAWVISYTGVSNEPRVLRQCEALTADGWDVVVCGFDGHSIRPPEWNFVRLPSTEPLSGIGRRLFSLTKRIGLLLLIYGRPAGMFEWAARLIHGATPLWFHTERELVALARAHPELRADLVISHDYHTANVGFALAQIYGAKFSMDVHEYAAGQYFNDPHWVKWERPVAVGVQRHYLAKADVVTTVCQGIADLLAKKNRLRFEPVVIRSVPFKAVQPFRPVGPRIEVLYHGDLSVRREIHTLIQSMGYWRQDIDLRLRGAGDPAYIADLKRQIARLNLEDRVHFEPPVPFAEIIPAANRSDIGFFSFKGDSPQIRFTLPNKLFEYIMAGLCLCVGDTEEVGRIVRQHRCGKLIVPHGPEAIAEAINSLSAEDIEAYKKASIAAAEQLNWECERSRLLRAYAVGAEISYASQKDLRSHGRSAVDAHRSSAS